MLGDLKPSLSGRAHCGIERVLLPEEDALVEESVRASAESGAPARRADRREAAAADRAAHRRRRGAHHLAYGDADRATLGPVEEQLGRTDGTDPGPRTCRLVVEAWRQQARRPNRHPVDG